MRDFLVSSAYFGVTLSVAFYLLGCWIKKKLGSWVNPLLISIILTISAVLLCRIDYQEYLGGAKYLSYFLTPATASLAIPLYEQLEHLKRNWKAILTGIAAGALISLLCVLAIAAIFHLDHQQYATLMPKSVTTAIGMPLSEEMGGYGSITAAVILITGVFGGIVAEPVFKLLKITEPVARGVALGTSAHAVGTTRAMEFGEVEGAMSGLSIAIAGILTVFASMFFARLW